MKTTKEFVKQFKLDVEGHQFNREEFLLELNKYFLEMVYLTAISNQLPKPVVKEEKDIYKPDFYTQYFKGNLTFDTFKRCVKQTEQKFWSISNKKAGGSFTKNLWGAFYAIYIVPFRANIFPEIEEQIALNRLKYQKS